MPISFTCPFCSQAMTVAEKLAGHQMLCHGCHQALQVPPAAPRTEQTFQVGASVAGSGGVHFRCPDCRTALRVKDELAGKRVKCPVCQAAVVVERQPPRAPASSADAIAASPAPGSVALPAVQHQACSACGQFFPAGHVVNLHGRILCRSCYPAWRGDAKTFKLKPHRGGKILILGLLSLCCCVFVGFLTMNLANEDLKEMRAGRMDASGEGLTQAGRVLGIIGVAVNVIGVFLHFMHK